ncbi:MAG: hypothetical protein GX044_04765 [Firmicutes bacterium]|nr:hypothetical protein [Bacillota bacterium]
MEVKNGFGTLLLTEPVTIRDVLHTLSFGNRAMILFIISLMAATFTDIGIGIPFDSDPDLLFKHVKYRCRTNRAFHNYCTFYPEEGDTTRDPQALLRTLRLNIWDASCSYSLVKPAHEQMRKLHELLVDAIENNRVPPEALDGSIVEEDDPLLYDTLEAAVEKVQQRTHYGMRQEKACGDGHIVEWSNGARAWFVHANREFAGEDLNLDANQIFLVGNSEYLTDIAAKLPELPLYKYSLEAKLRN